MNYIDTKYISLISHRLRNFTKKGDFLWNFSCPYCGDSQKNRKKARGFIYRTKNDLFYKCHNCSHGTNLSKLIEYVDPSTHKEYVMERYKEGSNGTPYKGAYKTPKPDFDFKTPVFKTFDGLKKFSEMEETHPSVKFLLDRNLPREAWNDIYFCPKFYDWTNSIIPNKFPSLRDDHPRVVIPFFARDGSFFAFQGRAFGKEIPKYITIKFLEDKPKIYGLDRLDLNKPIKITEGPIDSLFLSNAVALAGADADINLQPQQCTMIFDNEPRNQEIINRMIKAVDKKFNLVVWPKSLKYKDINDMIIAGKTSAEIETIISNNTYCGLTARQHINNWKGI